MPDTHRFQEEFDALKARLLEMGGLAEERVRAVIRALVDRDVDVIERIGSQGVAYPYSRPMSH